MCHIIASMINYHMTHISTNNKCLKPGIYPKFNQLQNIPLTQTRCHDNPSLTILSMSSPAPAHFLYFPLAAKMQRPPFQSTHWSLKCMAHYNFLLLIIIPGIHNLACFMMTRSLVISIKPCLIWLKFIFPHIATLSLFFHCTSMFISYALIQKTHQLRDYLC